MHWFWQRKKKQADRILVAIHGFGKRRKDEFATLQQYAQTHDIQLITPQLYDAQNEQDNQAAQWYQRAEKALAESCATGQQVALLGFSMGGVIASRLATQYPVSCLILIAPAFEYITLRQLENIFRDLTGRAPVVDPDYPPLPGSFTQGFINTVDKGKDSLAKIHCPVLIFHGTADHVIPVRSSKNAIRRLQHTRCRLFLLDGVSHRVLDSCYRTDVFLLIDHFMKNPNSPATLDPEAPFRPQVTRSK